MELILEHMIGITMDTTQKCALMNIKAAGGTRGMHFARRPILMESTITLLDLKRQESSGLECLKYPTILWKKFEWWYDNQHLYNRYQLVGSSATMLPRIFKLKKQWFLLINWICIGVVQFSESSNPLKMFYSSLNWVCRSNWYDIVYIVFHVQLLYKRQILDQRDDINFTFILYSRWSMFLFLYMSGELEA